MALGKGVALILSEDDATPSEPFEVIKYISVRANGDDPTLAFVKKLCVPNPLIEAS
jgi:hypothetical protein